MLEIALQPQGAATPVEDAYYFAEKLQRGQMHLQLKQVIIRIREYI